MLSYEDGGTETVSLYDTDSNGNELTGYILENDGLYLEGALPEGTYTVRFQCGGAWKDVEIQAVPVEAYLNSEYAAGLELGQEQSFGGASQNVIYDFAFTAPAQGRYSFSLTGSESRLSLYNLQGEWLDDSDRACTAWLEEGERILVRVNCGGNGETEKAGRSHRRDQGEIRRGCDQTDQFSQQPVFPYVERLEPGEAKKAGQDVTVQWLDGCRQDVKIR